MNLNIIRSIELKLFKNSVITTKTMTKLTINHVDYRRTQFMDMTADNFDQHSKDENKQCIKNMKSQNVT